jgi:hypothetical protein
LKDEEKFGFDPTVIMKVIVENRELGLALVQIPLTLLNNWLGGQSKEIHWVTRAKVAGYYWVKDSSDMITIAFISPDDLMKKRFYACEFAGPLVPPK